MVKDIYTLDLKQLKNRTMEIIYLLFMTVSWGVVAFICMYIIIFARACYKDGYEECYQTYHYQKKVSSYEDAVTPYEIGWNKAFKEIYSRL